MKSVLIVTDVPFWHRKKGNQQRISELVNFLAGHYSVSVFYMGQDEPPRHHDLTFISFDPFSGGRSLAWRILNGLPARLRATVVTMLNSIGYRRSLISFISPELFENFRNVVEEEIYDAVVIEYLWYGYLIDAVDRSKSTVFLDVHDIFHKRVDRYAHFGRVPDKVVTQQEELEAYRKFDYLIAIQRPEYDYLSELFPGKTLLAMHPHRPEPDVYPVRLGRPRSDEKLNLVYFGSFGDQNVDAINWFVKEVLSTDLAHRFELNVYGSVCDGLATRVPGVHLCGAVSNIRSVYSDADVAINPVRFGSGLKIKNIEALAFGVPLVTTTVGAEGLEEGVGLFFLCADSREDFQRQLLRLTDVETRRSISVKALAFVGQNLTPEACFGPIKSAIDEGPCNTVNEGNSHLKSDVAVSVVLPVYNGAKTIAATVTSVLQQTFSNFELIVINDGSTDPTPEIIAEFSDARVSVHTFENRGLAASRNRGIRLASSEFIAFIDADDLWAADKLEYQVSRLRSSPEAALVYSWSDLIDENDYFLNHGSHVRFEGNVFENLLVGSFLDNGSNALIRKVIFDQVGMFDEMLTAAEDWDMWLRIAYGHRVVNVPAVQIFYRVHGAAMSSSIERQESECRKVITAALNRVKPSTEKDELERNGRRHLYLYLAARVAQTNTGFACGRMAAGYLRKFWAVRPLQLRFIPRALAISVKVGIVSILPDKFSKLVLKSLAMVRGRYRKISLAGANH